MLTNIVVIYFNVTPGAAHFLYCLFEHGLGPYTRYEFLFLYIAEITTALWRARRKLLVLNNMCYTQLKKEAALRAKNACFTSFVGVINAWSPELYIRNNQITKLRLENTSRNTSIMYCAIIYLCGRLTPEYQEYIGSSFQNCRWSLRVNSNLSAWANTTVNTTGEICDCRELHFRRVTFIKNDYQMMHLERKESCSDAFTCNSSAHYQCNVVHPGVYLLSGPD